MLRFFFANDAFFFWILSTKRVFSLLLLQSSSFMFRSTYILLKKVIAHFVSIGRPMHNWRIRIISHLTVKPISFAVRKCKKKSIVKDHQLYIAHRRAVNGDSVFLPARLTRCYKTSLTEPKRIIIMETAQYLRLEHFMSYSNSSVIFRRFCFSSICTSNHIFGMRIK